MLESELEAQKNIAPFLENRVLRRVIQTFTNDPSGDFGKWASNPRVIEMLREAKRMVQGMAPEIKTECGNMRIQATGTTLRQQEKLEDPFGWVHPVC